MSNTSSPASSSLESDHEKGQTNSIHDSVTDQSQLNHRIIFGSDTESESSDVLPFRQHQSKHTSSEEEDDNASPNGDSVKNSADAPVSARDILGSDVDSEEDEDGAPQRSATAASLGSSEYSVPSSSKRQAEVEEPENDEIVADDNDQNQAAKDAKVKDGDFSIAADFPPIRADLGKDIYLVKMPNFLSVETRPFDPAYYEGELDEDEVFDEEGRTRLKLKVENTIRWRTAKNEKGKTVYESNARMVKWSDGSFSLHLGDEIFDVHKMDVTSDYNHLFIREDRGLQCQTVFRNKLTFRPHSTDSFTHRKMTLSLADKTSKTQKVKILTLVGANPELERVEQMRKEEEGLKRAIRQESMQRRQRERQMAAASAHRHRRAGFDSPMDSEEDNSVSLNAIKRNAKASYLLSAQRSKEHSSYSDEDSASDLSETRRRKKARISDEDDSD